MSPEDSVQEEADEQEKTSGMTLIGDQRASTIHRLGDHRLTSHNKSFILLHLSGRKDTGSCHHEARVLALRLCLSTIKPP